MPESLIHIPAQRVPLNSPISVPSPKNQFNFSWDAKSLPHNARYGISLSGDLLVIDYSCPYSPLMGRTHNQGDFVEGLWEYDVGELFVYAPRTGVYQEYNIAPTGAWWSCRFSAYRQRIGGVFSKPSVKTEATYSESGWEARLTLPIDRLALPDTTIEDLRFNICIIQGQNPRHYLSAATIATEHPDFHHVESFLPISITE